MTTSDGEPGMFIYTDGPEGFGNAFEVQADSEQCLIHQDFTHATDTCTGNPILCTEGLSLSVWYKTVHGLDRFEEFEAADPNDSNLRATIVSTGGDTLGHPGIAIYHQGMSTVAVVSTGEHYWKVVTVGMFESNRWTNLAISWDSNQGLKFFINSKIIGSTEQPKLSSQPSRSALSPTEIMLGCHRDSTNTAYRDHNTASFDELAVFNQSLKEEKTAYFLGGFIPEFANKSMEDIISLVDKANMDNPDTAALVYKLIADKTYSEPSPSGGAVAPSPTASTTTSTSTTTTTTTTSTSSSTSTSHGNTEASITTTAEPMSEEYKSFMTYLQQLEKVGKNVPKNVELEKISRILVKVDMLSNFFSKKNVEHLQELQKEDRPGTPEIVEDLGNWLLQLMQNLKYGNRTELFQHTKVSQNLIINLFKAPKSKLRKDERNFLVAPSCKMMATMTSWNSTCNRAAVSCEIITDSNCTDRVINLVISSSRTLHMFAPNVVNKESLDPSHSYMLNSMVLDVKMAPDPPRDEDGEFIEDKDIIMKSPTCEPDPIALQQQPIRLKMFHFQYNTQSHKTRKLMFHEHDIVERIAKHHCVWWNSSAGDHGAWDSTGCVIMFSTDTYTKCACGHFGTFAVLAQLVEPKEVPEEHLWLTVLRYFGYALSTLFIIIYIAIVAMSRDLKDQFHLMGLNLALATLLGAIAMLVSDIHAVRDDRHSCTAIGTLIHFFYQAAGAWVLSLGHAAFNGITAGVIGGRLKSYMSISWGLPLISVGLTYLLFMMDLGEDPRCFISWENPAKWVFFGFQTTFVVISCMCAIVVLCNTTTTALRKDNLIDDYGSFCRGAAFLFLFFDLTWIFGFLCYLRLGFKHPDFYPIFQVLNSCMGVIIFLFIGMASQRFKMVAAGQAQLRRSMLLGYAFGKPKKSEEEYAILTSSTPLIAPEHKFDQSPAKAASTAAEAAADRAKKLPAKKLGVKQAQMRTFTAD